MTNPDPHEVEAVVEIIGPSMRAMGESTPDIVRSTAKHVVRALDSFRREDPPRLQEAEAHLWALVVWFGAGKYEHPYIERDLSAAASYVNRHLVDGDMTARHRSVLSRALADEQEGS